MIVVTNRLSQDIVTRDIVLHRAQNRKKLWPEILIFFGRSNKLWPAISIFELPKMELAIIIKEMSVFLHTFLLFLSLAYLFGPRCQLRCQLCQKIKFIKQ